MSSLSQFCARHARWVIAAWLVALVVSAGLVARFGAGAFTTDVQRADGSDSVRAAALLAARFPEGGTPLPSETLIVRSASVTVDDPAFRRQVEAVHARLRALGGRIVPWSTSYYATGDAALVSADRRAALVPFVLLEPRANIERLRATVRAAELAPGFEVLTVGRASVGRDYLALARADLKAELRYGLPAALVVLLAVFATVVAALLPLLAAAAAIGVALAATVLAGQAEPAYFLVVNMIVMMGLALGIDYSLFILSRVREERAAGRDLPAAIGAAGATAARAVLYSGVTVACALAGLMLVPTNVFRGLGAGALLAVLASVLAALTLLPALVGLLGDRLEALRLPLFGRARATGEFWERAARRVLRRPALSLAVSAALLLAAAAPALQMKPGFAGIETLPAELPSRQAFRFLHEQFDYGVITATLVVVDGELESPAAQQALSRLRAALDGDPAYLIRSARLRLAADGRTAALAVPMDGDAEDPRIQGAVERLRREHVPAALGDAPVRALVGGSTAGYLDFFALTARYTPAVLAFVLGTTFLLLMLAFRSLVVPLKAVALNLLSVGAAFGLTVLVFQHGVGAALFGFRQVDFVEAWLPLFLFCVLFGLSMDYHVFLLSRIRERYERAGGNEDAVAYGLGRSGGIITGAALIMVAIFGGFASGELVMFQQAGFGLAVAVLLDATLVRVVMVPAAMALLGERNWYLPRWLGWLPRL